MGIDEVVVFPPPDALPLFLPSSDGLTDACCCGNDDMLFRPVVIIDPPPPPFLLFALFGREGASANGREGMVY